METRHYLSYIYEPEAAREDGSAYSTVQALEGLVLQLKEQIRRLEQNNNLRDRIVRKVAEYEKLRDDYQDRGSILMAAICDEKIKILEEILEDTVHGRTIQEV